MLDLKQHVSAVCTEVHVCVRVRVRVLVRVRVVCVCMPVPVHASACGRACTCTCACVRARVCVRVRVHARAPARGERLCLKVTSVYKRLHAALIMAHSMRIICCDSASNNCEH